MRLKASSCRVIETALPALSESGRGCGVANRRATSRSSSRSLWPRMIVSRLLKSCATPPASRPTASILWAWRRRSSSALCSSCDFCIRRAHAIERGGDFGDFVTGGNLEWIAEITSLERVDAADEILKGPGECSGNQKNENAAAEYAEYSEPNQHAVEIAQERRSAIERLEDAQSHARVAVVGKSDRRYEKSFAPELDSPWHERARRKIAAQNRRDLFLLRA